MFTYMLRRSQMKFIHMIRTAKQKWNSLVTKQLRKVGIFKRLNISRRGCRCRNLREG